MYARYLLAARGRCLRRCATVVAADSNSMACRAAALACASAAAAAWACIGTPQATCAAYEPRLLRAHLVENRLDHPRPSLVTDQAAPTTVRAALRLLARALWLEMLLLPPLLLLLPAMYFTGAKWRQLFDQSLLTALERGGPCLTKLGQWASTRPDLLPRHTCTILASLHHHVPSHSLGHTEAAIEHAFGAPAEALFQHVSAEPVGSGCIAQVHAATGLDGTALAIKVLHPDVDRQISDDLYLLGAALAAAHKLLAPFAPGLRWLALQESLAEFSAFMRRQIDLRVEAENLETFAANFSAPGTRVHFPRPLAEPGSHAPCSLVSRTVLVETFLEGETLSAILARDAASDANGVASRQPGDAARNKELARLGLDTFLTMLLRHNFVHADLHPGNILVARHASSNVPGDGDGGRVKSGNRREYSLGLVDAGLVVQLAPRDRDNFLKLFSAIGRGDGALAGELMLTHAREQRCTSPEAFREGMRAVVARARAGERGAFTLSNLRIGEVLLEVTNLVREHRVQVDPTFTTLVCSIVVLEGLGRQLDPSLDLFTVAAEVAIEAL